MIKYLKYNIYIYKIIIGLLLLSLIIFFYGQKKKFDKFCKIEKRKNNSVNYPIINNYKLYNQSDNPFISLIFDFSKLKIELTKNALINFVTDLSNQTYQNFQIVIIYNESKDIFENIMIKSNFNKKKTKLYKIINNDWIKSFFSLLSEIEGRFLIIIDKLIRPMNIKLHDIYNSIKGSINNIFKYKYQKNNYIYIIRTKIIKDMVDTEKEFNNFNDIINYIYIDKYSNPKINYIPISFCPDNYYTSLTYTSMISILISKDYYTYISFFLIIPENFSQKNILFFESLYDQFEYFNITFIKMDNRYKNAYANRYITKNAFFRLSLGELIPNLDKIIYLDSDTICLKDLSKLYNINCMGKIFLAKIKSYDPKNHEYTINTGVLLLNLKKMRKMQIEKKALILLKNGFKDPIFHDQAIINIFFKKYIGFIPPEYNAYPFSFRRAMQYLEESGGLYDFDSIYFSFKFPSIVHYRGNPENKTYNQEDWYYFARKSKYFQKRARNITNIFNFVA